MSIFLFAFYYFMRMIEISPNVHAMIIWNESDFWDDVQNRSLKSICGLKQNY